MVFPESLSREISIPGPDGMDSSSITLAVEIPTQTHKRTVLKEVVDNEALTREWEGAELVAIDSIGLNEWQRENFLFCKFALRIVCDRYLGENLLGGLLSWRGGPLVYSFRKGAKKIDMTVSFKKPGSRGPRYERRQCAWKSNEHYPGFQLIHKGYFACLFQKKDDATTVILRVSSFQYKRGKRVDPKSPIQTMKQETDALKAVWVPKSASIKHLIFDLIDNGGGNEPMDYYRLLLRKPFQEQYMRFKKFPEIDADQNRRGIFNGDPAQDLWFHKQVKSGE